MNPTEKEISYNTTNSYSTLNALTAATKNVWLVCHGMGYLSRYFLKYFKTLPASENYIIAPQAPSKYYIKTDFKHVGACWLTKENTVTDTDNLMRYLDAIFKKEALPDSTNLIVLGYSQGVSIAMRYLAKRQKTCAQLILHSGGIPKELTAADFLYLPKTTSVTLVYGTDDPYLTDARIAHETERARTLFGKRLKILPFEGKHIVNTAIINSLV
ncbi:alpha/beta hydrolase [Bizionia sediminis]|uniref:Alpha/beta hydrolase n=1 Tax=Bizionia sediminis TaxID=1737064 RepID=A0ABW5KPS0_9FLAO